ncbi:MAG TPA: universal stress protein [Candidatus Sulfotelmatobacter sp.]|jgi:nucleotide-binding universal stress UspA family protein|nr:universal stress protein [Candidatus Sulfotelmatobacter sp.]
MTDVIPDRRQPPKKNGRTFLVVVDDSEEMRAALRYACRRARNSGGRVALLRVVEPAEFQHFASIADLMREEARDAAEALLNKLAAEVNETSGELPMLYVREGVARDELLDLINEEPSISILVLAAGTGPEGPGPLVSALTGKYVNRLRTPLTIVPGTLTDEAIDALT